MFSRFIRQRFYLNVYLPLEEYSGITRDLFNFYALQIDSFIQLGNWDLTETNRVKVTEVR